MTDRSVTKQQRVVCRICKRLILVRKTDGKLRVHRTHGRATFTTVCMGSETPP